MRTNTYLIIGALVVFALMLTGIQYTQEYRFFTLESNHLFLYDATDLWNKLQQPGGAALVVASFLTQFWCIPYVGTIIVAVCYLLIAFLFYLILCKKFPGIAMTGLSLIPLVFLYLCFENDYYRFQGHIAYLVLVLALWGYHSLLSRHWIIRMCIGMGMVVGLYWLAGSVAVVFSISACLMELLERKLRGWWSLSYIAVAFLVGFTFVRLSLVKDMESAFTPYMYYDWPSTYFFPAYAWVILPLLLLIACLLAKIPSGKVSPALLAVLGSVFAFYLAFNLYTKVHSHRGYRFLQEQYWADNGEWSRIIETADRRTPTYLLSYLNLALAEKELLVGRYGQYNQQNPTRLLMWADPHLKNGKRLLSRIYFSWGYVSEARQAAFDANLLTPGSCHPKELQVMIQTNLVLGAYGVAEKYIALLEKTLYYKEWATSMRRFLSNDKAVSEDSVLGHLQASISPTSPYVRYESLLKDMKDILNANPFQKILSQFYEVYSKSLKEDKQ